MKSSVSLATAFQDTILTENIKKLLYNRYKSFKKVRGKDHALTVTHFRTKRFGPKIS